MPVDPFAVLRLLDEPDGVGEEDIQGGLDAAARLVSDRLTGKGLGDATVVQIEENLAAHFASVRAPWIVQGKWADRTERYSGTFGEGLKSTPWGQAAITLDWTGTLADIARETDGPAFRYTVGTEP